VSRVEQPPQTPARRPPGSLDALVGKAVSFPRRGVALDHEGVHVPEIAIMMRMKSAEVGLTQGLPHVAKVCGARGGPGEFFCRWENSEAPNSFS